MHRSLAVIAAIVASTPTPAAERRAIPREEVPATLAAAMSRGEVALDALRERLFARLNALIVEGGPVHAIQACRSEAPALARQLGAEHRVQMGRTSFRLRNPGNAPPRWAEQVVAASSGKKGNAVTTTVFDLGDRVGVLRPITVMPACTRCHGAVEGIDSDVRAELAQSYPSDQATRFAPGDLRGFMWAEVPKR